MQKKTPHNLNRSINLDQNLNLWELSVSEIQWKFTEYQNLTPIQI